MLANQAVFVLAWLFGIENICSCVYNEQDGGTQFSWNVKTGEVLWRYAFSAAHLLMRCVSPAGQILALPVMLMCIAAVIASFMI